MSVVFSGVLHSVSLGNLLSCTQATYFSLEWYYDQLLLFGVMVDISNPDVLRLGPASLLTRFQHVTESLLPDAET